MRLKLTNIILLIFIIIVAAALRFYNLTDIPYTYDEFSALFRTHFDSFSELIEKGVKVDTLPAGIQVFLFYWTKLFGYSEWIVKLPFILSGILSVYLIYLIAKSWYNETVALISASFLASIQYTIMYSQIARPYASGLFLSLLMVYFWTKMIMTPQKRFYQNSVLFIISASLCAYNHHFSLLFASIAGVTGLFFIQRQYMLKYIFSGVFIFALYIPHIKIFLHQLNMGGNEGWLGEIHNEFIINYLGYIFNFSVFSYALVIILVLFGFMNIGKPVISFRQFALFASWFFLPFLIGFFYSKYVNNVLQFSVLIFSFPFLYFILFGHIKPQKTIINLFIVLAILSINIYSVIMIRKHYNLFYQSHYIQILDDHQKALNSFKGIASIIDSDHNISDYYIEKLKLDSNFTWYDSFITEKDLINYLERQSQLSEYLYLGCVSGNNPLSVAIIKDYYPAIEIQNNYAGGTTYVFSTATTKENNIIEYQDFEIKEKSFWSPFDKSKFVDTICFSGEKSYLIDDKTEWSPSYSRSLNEIIINKTDFIDISVKAYLLDTLNSAMIVASLESKDSLIYWRGALFNKFIAGDAKGGWIKVHHSLKLSDIYLNYPDIQLKIYLWNKDKNNFLIDDLVITLRKGNPVVYGLFKKL